MRSSSRCVCGRPSADNPCGGFASVGRRQRVIEAEAYHCNPSTTAHPPACPLQVPRAAGAAARHTAASRRPINQAAALSSVSQSSESVEAEVVPAYEAPQPLNEANLVADLETILKERDACGVSARDAHWH